MGKIQNLNWFEKYAMNIVNEFGSPKNLIIAGLASLGVVYFGGFVPVINHTQHIITL